MKVRVYWYHGKSCQIYDKKGHPYDTVVDQIKQYCEENGYTVHSHVVEARTRHDAVNVIWSYHKRQGEVFNDYFCEKVL